MSFCLRLTSNERSCCLKSLSLAIHPVEMNHLDVAINCQILFTFMAVLLNSILLYLILWHTRCNMGFYKYLLAGYSAFEMLFAIAVFIGMPVSCKQIDHVFQLHFVSDRTWLAFSYRGLLNGTKWGYLGPVMFCWFYEIWIAFSIGNFVYRYMVVCRFVLIRCLLCTYRNLRATWVERIKRSCCLKSLIIAGILTFVLYVTFCAFILCTKPEINPVSSLYPLLYPAFFRRYLRSWWIFTVFLM